MNPHNGTETSKAAAKASVPHSHSMRNQVLFLIERTQPPIGARGYTCDQIEEVTGLSHQTASARINELAEAGKIEQAGIKRNTRRGCAAEVWVKATGPRKPKPQLRKGATGKNRNGEAVTIMKTDMRGSLPVLVIVHKEDRDAPMLCGRELRLDASRDSFSDIVELDGRPWDPRA